MLKNYTKKVTLTASSAITVQDGDAEKEVVIENYYCSIDSEKPEEMNLSKSFQSAESKTYYKDNRESCRNDYTSFQKMAQDLQDEMFAILEAEKA